MLNKLLKRCMPWMDKGRWVQIRVAGSDPSNITTFFDTNVFSDVETSMGSDGLQLIVTANQYIHIVEWKFCPDDAIKFFYMPDYKDMTQTGENGFMVKVHMPGTFWFYITHGVERRDTSDGGGE